MDITIIYGYGHEACEIDDYSCREGMKAVAQRYGFDYDWFLFEAGYLSEETPALSDFLTALKENFIFESAELPLSYDAMDGVTYIYFKACMPWDEVPNMPTSYHEADQFMDEFLSLLFGKEYHGTYSEIANASFS